MSITDRIRKQLDQPDALTMEAIEPLAEAYGQETQQANARLSECIQLLRKGFAKRSHSTGLDEAQSIGLVRQARLPRDR